MSHFNFMSYLKQKPGFVGAVFSLTVLFSCHNIAAVHEGTLSDEAQVIKMLSSDSAVLMDVRTPEEVAEGFIPGTSVFIDYKSADFGNQIAALDTARTYIVYCRSGARSSAAVDYMKAHGFHHVYNCEGGILAWKGELTKH